MNNNNNNNNNKNNNNNNKQEGKQKSSKRAFVRRFTTNSNESVLQHAIKNSDAESLQKLLQDVQHRTEINHSKSPGVTVFHQACVFGDVKIIQILLSNGADVNLRTWSKLSPVKIATIFGHFDAARLLVESGADQVDVVNGYQEELNVNPL